MSDDASYEPLSQVDPPPVTGSPPSHVSLPGSPRRGTVQVRHTTAPVSGAKTLRVSLISQNSDLVAVGPGFVAVDSPITISCPVASCTFEVDQNLQASTTVANNRWAICTQLDGSFMSEPSCPYLGKLPSDGSYQAGTFVQTATHVPNGTHTVQTFIYTDFGGNRSIYAMVYRVYTP